MPDHPCPRCNAATTTHLLDASRNSVLDYYRCDHCWHVWSVSKMHPDAPPRDVTPEPLKLIWESSQFAVVRRQS